MIKRVLFVDSDAEALARIKRAVEQAGNYEAKVFITGKAALEYAADNPPDLAVIALNVPDIEPLALTEALRQIRPGLPLLLRAPADSDQAIIDALNPHDVVHGGYTARVLLPMVDQAITQGSAPSSSQPRTIKPGTGGIGDDMTAFDEVLESIPPGDLPQDKQDTFNVLVQSMRTPPSQEPLPRRRQRLANWAVDEETPEDTSPAPAIPPEQDALFQKLAAEEPPLPSLEESGTVSDLIAVTDFGRENSGHVVEIPDEMIDDLDKLELAPEEHALLEALAAVAEPENPDEAPADSGPDLVPMPEAIKTQLENGKPPTREPAPPPAESPAPSARPSSPPQGVDRAALAVALTQQTLEMAAQATILLRNEAIMAMAGALPENEITEIADMIDPVAILREQATKIKFVSLPASHLNFMVVAAPTVDDMVLVTVFPENMHLRTIRQQTRHLLETLTATAEEPAPEPAEPPPPLVQEETPPPSDTGLYETPAPDPSEEIFTLGAEPDEAAHGLTGAIESEQAEPLSASSDDAEGDQLDAREPTESAPAIDPATLVKYACAWILRDPAAELDAELISALPRWLENIITTNHWLHEQIDVQPDYISTVVSVSPNDSPSEVIQTLMEESAQRILAARPDLEVPDAALWADAYYIIAPGRPLTGEEISRFISYQREAS
jgi:CheY-like chemotaxis protein/REP element-mobilizing transposase RayT